MLGQSLIVPRGHLTHAACDIDAALGLRRGESNGLLLLFDPLFGFECAVAAAGPAGAIDHPYLGRVEGCPLKCDPPRFSAGRFAEKGRFYFTANVCVTWFFFFFCQTWYILFDFEATLCVTTVVFDQGLILGVASSLWEQFCSGRRTGASTGVSSKALGGLADEGKFAHRV